MTTSSSRSRRSTTIECSPFSSRSSARRSTALELDRPVGTDSELAAYHASQARADADFTATWNRIAGLIKTEIDQLLAPDEAPKDGKPRRKRTSLPAIAANAFRTAAPEANARRS